MNSFEFDHEKWFSLNVVIVNAKDQLILVNLIKTNKLSLGK